MLKYSVNLKDKARQLRRNLTDSEKALWSRLRSKQVLGIQFYRQKPIGEHIVDFFAQGQNWSWKWMGPSTWEPITFRKIGDGIDIWPLWV